MLWLSFVSVCVGIAGPHQLNSWQNEQNSYFLAIMPTDLSLKRTKTAPTSAAVMTISNFYSALRYHLEEPY